jgi:cell division ATPase FtsA
MIFLSLKNHQVKLLVFKKTIFSHYEVDYFEKTHQTQLLKDGQIINIDILASAIKEGLTLTKKSEGEKEVFLILPQDFFIFLRTEVPLDLSSSAVESYVFDFIT